MADDSVEFGWVMEVTFVVTVLVGTPLVIFSSLFVELDGWTARLVYATTIAAAVWFVTAIAVYLVARRRLMHRQGRAER